MEKSTNDMVIVGTRYFFEVLVKNYLEIEKEINKQSGILFIFKKIDFSKRIKIFEHLLDISKEANTQIPQPDSLKEDYFLYNLAAKLIECISIYNRMIQLQIVINNGFLKKANGESYNLSTHAKNQNIFEMVRDSLESELPKLQSLLSTMLLNIHENQNNQAQNNICLADKVFKKVSNDLGVKFDDIVNTLNEIGIDKNDFEELGSMYIDMLIYCLAVGSKAVNNLLDEKRAKIIYTYMSSEMFEVNLKLDKSSQDDMQIIQYCNDEFNDYVENDKGIEQVTGQYAKSKLFERILGENISKYSGSNSMMYFMFLDNLLIRLCCTWKEVLIEEKIIL